MSTSFLESFLASGIESVHLASDFFLFPFARQIVQLFDKFLAATIKRIFNHVTASLNVSILSHREDFLGIVLNDKNFSVAIIEVHHFLSPFLSFVKFNLAESAPFVNRFFVFLVEHEANKHGSHTEAEGTSNAKTGSSTFAIVMGSKVAHKNVEETEQNHNHNQEPLEENEHFKPPFCFSLSHRQVKDTRMGVPCQQETPIFYKFFSISGIRCSIPQAVKAEWIILRAACFEPRCKNLLPSIYTHLFL